MRVAHIVARELLWCRLMEIGRDALLERVAELLEAACRGTPPFCSMATPQVVAEVRARPRRAHAPPGASRGSGDTSTGNGAGRPSATASLPGGTSADGPPQGRARMPHGGCGTPAQRKPERPVFQPRDRGEVFWNMALLSIEPPALYYNLNLITRVPILQWITSARRHYANHGCSIQAA